MALEMLWACRTSVFLFLVSRNTNTSIFFPPAYCTAPAKPWLWGPMPDKPSDTLRGPTLFPLPLLNGPFCSSPASLESEHHPRTGTASRIPTCLPRPSPFLPETFHTSPQGPNVFLRLLHLGAQGRWSGAPSLFVCSESDSDSAFHPRGLFCSRVKHSTEYSFAFLTSQRLWDAIQISWNNGLASRLKSQILIFFLKQPFYFHMCNLFLALS